MLQDDGKGDSWQTPVSRRFCCDMGLWALTHHIDSTIGIQTTYCWSMDYVVSVLADHRSRLLQRADVSGSVSSELLEKLVRRKDSGEAIRMLFNEAIPDRSRPLRDALYSYIRADESLAMMLLQRGECRCSHSAVPLLNGRLQTRLRHTSLITKWRGHLFVRLMHSHRTSVSNLLSF